MAEVIVVIGAGHIGQAIARRVGVAKHVLLADMRLENANAAAEVMANAGNDPKSGPIRNRTRTRRVRQRYRSWWSWRRYRIAVWASPSSADGGAKQSVGHDTR